MLSNGAVQQHTTWWGRGHGRSASDDPQAMERPDRKAACPEDGAVHSPVWQEVVPRVDQTDQAVLRRVANGETPGYPRVQGTTRYPSFT